MRRPVLLLLAVAMTVSMLAPNGAPVAHACLGVFDLSDADLVVGGRITGWEEIEDAIEDPGGVNGIDSPDYYGPYTAIRVRMSVDTVYKGNSGRSLVMVSGNTLMARGPEGQRQYQWVGSSGACGAFDYDPTGRYWIIGLHEDKYGRLFPSLFSTLYSGESPPASFDDPWLSQIKTLLPGSAPSENPQADATRDGESITPILATGAAVGVALLIVMGLTWWLRRAR